MINRDLHRSTVDQVVPDMFRDMVEDFQYPPQTNLAASNQCHVLTKGLYVALENRGLDVKREYHEGGGIFHYIINHHPEAQRPAEDDIITDLNPWQFMEDSHPSKATHTYLHGPRQEVMERLEKEGAPAYFIALRGLATVARAHTLLMVHQSQRTLHIA